MRSEYGEHREDKSPWGIAAGAVTACGFVMVLIAAFSRDTQAPLLEASISGADSVAIIELNETPEVASAE